jgi:hypothetical protein
VETRTETSAAEWIGLERFDPLAMSAAGGVVAALLLFVATVVLLLQGPAPGAIVGWNLQGLGDYLPGYAVNWPGAFVGALYGGIAGAITGFVVALFWNITHLLIIRLLLLQRLISRI